MLRAMNPAMNEWTLGRCANCDSELDWFVPATLYCSEKCHDYAKDVRYFRACRRDGRMGDPKVREALRKRMAFLVVGGYRSGERHVAAEMRSVVLAANGGLCCLCNKQPSTEVDHINGPSGERKNLQGLCNECHNTKTAQSFEPMTPEDMVIRDAFLARVDREPPLRASDNDLTWKVRQRSLMAETRKWCDPQGDEFEAGYFGDGSTGTEDDYEHGIYLEMLANRDD
jgi:5-methylcytosine-specific restriction endonuclease McrA